MKLDSITLTNFRQYYGRQALKFARDGKRNVTVLHGVNGAGKTSLFTALNWCLYGEELPDVGLQELVSKEAISRAKVGEVIHTTVDLAFLHDGERYLIRRAARAIKGRGKTSVELDPHSDFTMKRTRPDGDAQSVSHPVSVINSILPANVRTYFLFDGEKIDNFAKPEASAEVRAAIYLVLKLELLERAWKHLDEAATTYRREIGRTAGGKLKELVESENTLRDDIKAFETRRKELASEIEIAKRHSADIERKLRESEASRALQDKRDILQREYTERDSEKQTLEARIRDLATSSYLLVGSSAVQRAVEVLEEKRARGEIPSSIRQQFVNDLLEHMKCVCGRSVSDGSDEHRHLLKLLETSVSGALEDDVITTSGTLASAFPLEMKRMGDDLAEFMQRRSELKDRLKELHGQLEDVALQLKGSHSEQTAKLEKQRESYESDIESRILDIGGIDERLADYNLEVAEIQAEIKTAQKQEEQGQLLLTKMDFAQQGADAIKHLHVEFGDEMRLKIEAKTKEIFQLLSWKGEHFSDVQLSPEYNLEVVDRYGSPARPDLSAGERQVLSLSFITAMSRVSEEEAPLVMDTPFGRLSSAHRESITKHLPELADQLVLFVTDEELRDTARRNIEKRIGSEYELKFNPKTSCTEIIEVTK